MPNPTDIHDRMKTITVMGIVNLILSPIYYFAGKSGIVGALAVNTAVIAALHEAGKEQRQVANFAVKSEVKASKFFNGGKVPSQVRDDQLDNFGKNISTGGAEWFDTVTSLFRR